jgi:hypothetical protein
MVMRCCCAGLDGGRRLDCLRLCVAASQAGHKSRLGSSGLNHVAAAAASERHFEVKMLMLLVWMLVFMFLVDAGIWMRIVFLVRKDMCESGAHGSSYRYFDGRWLAGVHFALYILIGRWNASKLDN